MTNYEYLSGLNNAQNEAVLYLDGPLLIVAGAGRKNGNTSAQIDKKIPFPQFYGTMIMFRVVLPVYLDFYRLNKHQ